MSSSGLQWAVDDDEYWVSPIVILFKATGLPVVHLAKLQTRLWQPTDGGITIEGHLSLSQSTAGHNPLQLFTTLGKHLEDITIIATLGALALASLALASLAIAGRSFLLR